MTRTILVHLNVELDEGDGRSADEIAEALMGAIEVGSDDASMVGLSVTMALADDVGEASVL